jgi:phytoene synthase
MPEDARDGAYALYGFCRLSDDAVDVEGGRLDAVARLRARLDRVYAGQPGAGAVDRALADAVARFDIPRVLLDALLEGMEWDVAGRRCETLADLHAYAARVAASVGAMMAAVMGARSPDLVARACDLGVAMQLTNIARDVGEDARAGRLYLPRDWMREAGIDPDAWLEAPIFNPRIASVIDRVLREADRLYARADAGIANLEPAFRPSIFAARHLYAEIGVVLRERGLDSISRRASTPSWRKLALMTKAVGRALLAPRVSPAGAPLEATRFLVDAVALDAARAPLRARARRRSLEEDFAWTIDLFATLEGRERRFAAR